MFPQSFVPSRCSILHSVFVPPIFPCLIHQFSRFIYFFFRICSFQSSSITIETVDPSTQGCLTALKIGGLVIQTGSLGVSHQLTFGYQHIYGKADRVLSSLVSLVVRIIILRHSNLKCKSSGITILFRLYYDSFYNLLWFCED